MTENNDSNAEAMTPDEGTGSGSTPAESGVRDTSPSPIFESFIYDFVGTETITTLAGEPTGRPGTIGGPINNRPPKYRVFTYPFIPPRGQDI